MKKRRWISIVLSLSLLLCGQAQAWDAAAPTRVPEIGETVTVYTKDDAVLDFSQYAFSVMGADGNEINSATRGLTNVMRIWVATEDGQQFTAYCLDAGLAYPASISNAAEESLFVRDANGLLNLFIETLKKDTAANGADPSASALFGDLMEAHGRITRFTMESEITTAMIDAFNNNERIDLEIREAEFADGYVATPPNGGYWRYGFWRNSLGVQTANFAAIGWPSGENYDRMLWVIEHSYPAIPLNE